MRAQKGVALLSMLLVLAIVTTVTSNMLYNNRLEIQRNQVRNLNAQAQEYALSGITWAKILIQKTTHPQAKIIEVFQPEEGSLRITLNDEMAKFNLNNLRDASGNIDSAQLQIFQRLLLSLQIDPVLAINLGDWLDADVSSAGYNSEDLGYENMPAYYAKGYRTANRVMAHSTELILVKGFSIELHEVLEPYVTALPNKTAININTASAELLEVLIPGIDGTRMVAQRERKNGSPFLDVDSFLQHQLSAGLEITPDLLTTTSQFYRVTTQASYRQQLSNWQALLFKARNPASAKQSGWYIQRKWQHHQPFWVSEVSANDTPLEAINKAL
jgi:general secretion pathway protein K